MNCFNHPEISAVAYCRSCGKALCTDCKRTAQGTIFCDEHAPAPAVDSTVRPAGAERFTPDATPMAAAPLPGGTMGDVSPGLACLLGFIPGVGAIYNGQYAKGLVHAIVFGLLVSITSSGTAGDLEPLFGILIGVWVMYMALEAYHTARKRRAGEAVDEFSSILDVHGRRGGFPVGAITLIGLGILLLLSTTDVIQLRYLLRYWPILLILAGAYMLYARISGKAPSGRCAMNANDANLLRAIRWPVTLITLGTLFALNNFSNYGFNQTWPVLLIVFGLLSLLGRTTAGAMPPPGNPGGPK